MMGSYLLYVDFPCNAVMDASVIDLDRQITPFVEPEGANVGKHKIWHRTDEFVVN